MSSQIIAYQGCEGANSNLACIKFYPNYQAKAFDSFYEVFEAVNNSQVEYGMIPLENSYAGRVSEIHDLLQKYDVSIVAEHFFPITHNLVGIKGAKLEDIKEVYSHPQALLQCQNNLRELKVKVNEFSNTAKSAEFIAKMNDKTKASLCSRYASDIHNLEIIKENMQDISNDNITIFIDIAKLSHETDPKI